MPTNDGRDAFDFLYGRWNVAHRRLRKRLACCTDWDQFAGTCHAMPLLGGLGNVDDNVIDLPSGSYCAASLRIFDPSTGDWRIWWIDSRQPQQIDAPMRGRFDDGTGIFLADDSLEGRPIRVRFLWLHTCSASPRWAQAFSADGGATWETNWEMTFSRQP